MFSLRLGQVCGVVFLPNEYLFLKLKSILNRRSGYVKPKAWLHFCAETAKVVLFDFLINPVLLGQHLPVFLCVAFL